jgi:hypothetical protein
VADARVVAGLVLAAAALVQAAFSATVPREWRPDRSIGPPPDARVAAVASLGETRGAAYGLALVLQGFDTQAGEQQRLRELDHDATAAWLARIGQLAPATGYDAYLATRIYADVMPAPVLRRVLAHVHARFLEAPDANWSSRSGSPRIRLPIGRSPRSSRVRCASAAARRRRSGPGSCRGCSRPTSTSWSRRVRSSARCTRAVRPAMRGSSSGSASACAHWSGGIRPTNGLEFRPAHDENLS